MAQKRENEKMKKNSCCKKQILAALYIATIQKKIPKEIIKGEIGGIKKECLKQLEQKKLIEKIENKKNKQQLRLHNNNNNNNNNSNKYKITPQGLKHIKIVLAGGVFDIIHPGHIHTLNEAKKLGDVLVVVIATDKTAARMKKRKPLHTQEQRKKLVDALKMVDATIVGNDNKNIFKTVEKIKPQIIALGYDQVHQEKAIIQGCQEINLKVKVARLKSPIPKISSSTITKDYGHKIYDT